MVHTEGENNRIEIWKDYKDYEGLYMVSNWGRAKSLDTYIKDRNGTVRFCKGRILKPVIVGRGYLKVNLYKNNKQKQYYVHRLVAEAFIPNPENLPEVNHKDENKLNNNAENLEWCDREYNCNFGTRNEKVAKKCSKPVVQYTLDGQFVREWESIRECGRNGFNQGNICMCCQGKLKKYKDFIWKYK